jgi:putative tryptophan/tyrosine transport system substrate-binding protein
VRRRDFITLIGNAAFADPLSARAQQPAKVYRIAFVTTTGSVAEVRGSTFFEEIRRLGYVEGRDLAVELFSGEGKEERYAALAHHVVQLKPDVIFARGLPMVLQFQQATGSIPVVALTSDPASAGITSSLARQAPTLRALVWMPGARSGASVSNF